MRIKHKLQSISILILAAQVLAGCGIKDKTKKEGFADPYLEEDMAPMVKQDNYCEEKRSENSIDQNVKVFISQFLNGELNQKSVNIYPYILSNNTMGSNTFIVGRVNYGGRLTRIDRYVYEETASDYFRVKEGRLREQTASQKLKICPTKESYQRYTYEAAAVSAVRNIDRTFHEIGQALPDVELQQVKVNIAPETKVTFQLIGGERNKQQSINFEVDNAYYLPSERSITFLPQGKTRYNEGKQPLWEVPMVAAHEFGHHVFQQLFLNKAGSDRTQAVHSHCFLDEEQHKVFQQKFLSTERDSSYHFTLRAINEGFADLISFYALPGDEVSLKGLDCFEDSREPESSNTSTGEHKVFTKSGRDAMDSSQRVIKYNKSCNNIDYQAVHSVGAIVAHQVDLLFTRLTFDRKKKLKYLLLWLNKLEENFSKLKSSDPSESVFLALELAYVTALENEEKSFDGKCEHLRVAFPNSETEYFCEYLK